MKDGAIHQIGTPEDILMRPQTDYVAEFVEDVDQGRVLEVETVREDAAAVAENAAVADVLRAIDRLGVDAAQVVDSDGRPLGVVTRESAEQARSGGTRELGGLARQSPQLVTRHDVGATDESQLVGRLDDVRLEAIDQALPAPPPGAAIALSEVIDHCSPVPDRPRPQSRRPTSSDQ
ncbi:CBS domain-containing protein [Candidatus Poriferisodalis sp.]|uniref:CBS domain-containing protein n=1 Tax=Candidatus Poriferisodalis sp. TaxID=3101277 RepID=UPI003B019D13